jgi:hypothetical protein
VDQAAEDLDPTNAWRVCPGDLSGVTPELEHDRDKDPFIDGQAAPPVRANHHARAA